MEIWRGEVDDSEGFLTVMEDFRCDDSGSEGLLMLGAYGVTAVGQRTY